MNNIMPEIVQMHHFEQMLDIKQIPATDNIPVSNHISTGEKILISDHKICTLANFYAY